MQWRQSLIAYGAAVLAVAALVVVGLMFDSGGYAPLAMVALFPAVSAIVFVVTVIPFLLVRWMAAVRGWGGYTHAIGTGGILGVLAYGGFVALMSFGDVMDKPLWFALQLGAGLVLGVIGGFVFARVERFLGDPHDR